jgi:hypothetical protein
MRTECLLAQVIRIVRLVAISTLPLIAILPATAAAMPPVLQPTATLTPPNDRYRQSDSVGIDGDYAVVGYYGEDFDVEGDNFIFEQTAVVYRRNSSGTWQHMQTLPPVIYGGQSRLPAYVAIRGNVIAFHALGQLHVFERTANGWQSSPVDRVSENPTSNFAYVTDLEIDNGTIVAAGVVCSEQEVRAFRKNASGTWVRVGTANIAPVDCSVGIAPIDVAISGNTTVMGVARLPDNTGAAYFYGAPSTWGQPAQTVSYPLGRGTPVAISGNLSILSGAELFQRSSGVWTFKQNLQRPEFAFSGASAVEIRGNLVAQAWSRSLSVFQADAEGNFSEFARLSRPGGELASFSLDISGRRVIAHDAFLDFAPEAYIYELPSTLTQPATIQETFQSGNAARWTPLAGGSWSVATTPVSRVYRQSSLSENATSLLSNTDWTNQSIQADIKPTAFSGSDRWFGLAVRRTDANNYYYLTARNSGSLQLKKIVNGAFQTLASTTLAVSTGSEYRLRLEAIGTTIRAYVDGVQMLQAIDSSLSHGQAALTMYRTAADYDNVIVSPSPQAVLFPDDHFQYGSDLWTNIGGHWAVITFENERVRYQNTGEGPASSVTGYASTADQSIAARVREVAVGTGTQPWFGLFVRYRDANNYYYVTVRNSNEISLRRLLNGVVTVLDSAPFTVTTGPWYKLRMEAIQDQLRVYADGRLILEGTDATISEGRYGAIMYKAATMYDDVAVTQP